MYGRAPAVLANLIAIGVSKYIFEAGFWWAALPLTLYAALTIYCAVSIIPEITNHSINPPEINPLTIKNNPSASITIPSRRSRATTVDLRSSGLENESAMRRTLLAVQ